jgi:hypothetical protein
MISTKKITKGQIESYTTADIADSVGKRYQTDNQQNYNDATSSIQTQLNSKRSWIVKDSDPTSAVTGTTSIVQVGASITVAAGTNSVNDTLVLESFSALKTGVLGTATIRLYTNTSDTLTGATLIATATITSTNLNANMCRTFEISGGLLKNRMLGNGAAYTDYTQVAGVGLSVTYNPAVTNYIFRTVQLANAGDSIVSTQLLISK